MQTSEPLDLKSLIRSIPDYPKHGIIFRDITTLISHADGFRQSIRELAAPYVDKGIDKIVGIEARGFIFGGAMADFLGVGFVPVRKPGKLPGEVISQDYSLEYGTDCIEMHADAISAGEKILVVDDLIATGGTAIAAIELLQRVEAVVEGAAFVIDLPDIGGADLLRARGIDVHTLICFEGH